MDACLLERLGEISSEEHEILCGGTLHSDAYFSGDQVVRDKRLFGDGAEIGIRRHTRFVDFPLHKHDFVEVMIVLSGELTHTVTGGIIRLSAGDILFLNKHAEHSIAKTGEGDIAVNIMLSDAFIAGITPKLSGTVFSPFIKENARSSGEGAYLHFSAGGSRAIENVTENIILELLLGRGDNVAAMTVELLFACLARESESLLVGGGEPTDKVTRRMSAVLEYIKANSATASLSELSGRLYLCVPYLSKTIKEYFGKSFKELVIDERMRRAELLFGETDMNIGDVIRAVGYENESYFHREFKRRYGKAPLGYRRGYME